MHWKSTQIPPPPLALYGKKFLFEFYSVTFECFRHDSCVYYLPSSSISCRKHLFCVLIPIACYNFFYTIHLSCEVVLINIRKLYNDFSIRLLSPRCCSICDDKSILLSAIDVWEFSQFLPYRYVQNDMKSYTTHHIIRWHVDSPR